MRSPDAEPTAVLPETATQLVELERLRQELAQSEERAKNHWDQYLRAVAEQHRAVERRRHNQPIKLGCREQRIVNRKSATVREPFECRRKRCNRPPGASGIKRRTKFWKASYLADHEPAQLQDPGSENDFELSDRIADQVAL